MRNSAVRSFSDPDEYDRSIRAGEVAGLRQTRNGFQAELTRVDLGRVWMQRFKENAARMLQVAVSSSRSGILFRVAEDSTPFRHRGVDFDPETVVFLGEAAVDSQTTEGPVEFGAMSLAPAELARFGPMLAERDLVSPKTTTFLRPHAEALARLRFLHASAGRLARTDPDRIEHPEVSRAFEDSFTTAMVACLGHAERVRTSHAGERRAALIRRMMALLDAQDAPVYVTELCAALGVTERSLERACRDHLGMGPKRYLWLRRMHLARRALVNGDPSRTTVAAVALSHGFWELGRFAVRYHQTFGEPPSWTLRKPMRGSASVRLSDVKSVRRAATSGL
jgi:AraC-like DNA-binding protein